MDDYYVYVNWPEVQDLMDEPWFEEEAILDTRPNAPSSCYLIPWSRIKPTIEMLTEEDGL